MFAYLFAGLFIYIAFGQGLVEFLFFLLGLRFLYADEEFTGMTADVPQERRERA